MRADAVNRLGGFIGQVTGARLDLLHDAYLNGSAADDVPGKLLASCQMSRRKAFAQIRYAADLNCSFPLIGRALRDGTLSPTRPRRSSSNSGRCRSAPPRSSRRSCG
ncbi:hypothetical protein G7085_12780 [Tessaracoccus sp. HDW20]|uniref:hypothetical protein n=1 Tax=Tessaracoccus coleopterorum TaxID=2714950 RepID=UPI0018D43501|nr:hypothetical protein [Tessaracoccus coleopterorum]NHB85200.1 hypothetical protein [Tessaracoccus coleopterorum]